LPFRKRSPVRESVSGSARKAKWPEAQEKLNGRERSEVTIKPAVKKINKIKKKKIKKCFLHFLPCVAPYGQGGQGPPKRSAAFLSSIARRVGLLLEMPKKPLLTEGCVALLKKGSIFFYFFFFFFLFFYFFNSRLNYS
jgi:hypothetical protein